MDPEGARLKPVRSLAVAKCCLWLLACGGGGGSDSQSPTFTLGTTTFTFTASSPSSAIPASQVATATVTNVTSGTLYLLVNVSNPQVVSVSNVVVTGTNSGQATLTVPYPARLGMGTYTSTIQVTACLNDPSCATGRLAGSPQTITVNYQIGSPVQQDTIMPGVVTADAGGKVVLRGSGFTGVTGVRFDSMAASAVTVVNDTELRVDYPPMPAGMARAVTLQKGSANVDFAAPLTVVDPIGFAATTLGIPPVAGIRYIPVGLAFDPVHAALLIGMRTISASPSPPYTPAQDFILRYPYSGGAWQAPTTRSFPNIRYATLSPDSQTLLAASANVIERLDAATLVSVGASAKPSVINEELKALAFTNDGNVVVATGYVNGSGHTRLYLYSMRDASFSLPRLIGSGSFADNSFYYAALGTSKDGSVALLGQPGSGGGRLLTRYETSTGKWVDTGERYNYYSSNATGIVWAPASDERGTRLVIPGAVAPSDPDDSSLIVLNADLLPTGNIATLSEGVTLVRDDGTRAYVLAWTLETPRTCAVRAFDLTAAPATASGNYPEITSGGYPIARPCLSTVSSPSIGALSPDERTLFVVGAESVSVIPLP
jgi:hypothetical protein